MKTRKTAFLEHLSFPEKQAVALHSVLADSPGSPAHTHAVEVDIPWMEEQITAAIADRRQV